ncbi:rCG61447 [Rattus norvegicus]|uniref:RCG61447 n=1 Tax=Rattus norvegicus TaxID=10116 RepID=A6HB66_RAT|nr:rCG61447 [Rattus norvegicus]
METSPEPGGTRAFSPSRTLPHRSGSPPKTFSIFFSKGICFRACVIKPEFYLLLNSPSVFFLTVSPTFWTEDRLCFLVKCWCTLRVF